MIKKLVISAVVLAALISGKEANAAGVGGFARALSSASSFQIHTADLPAFDRHDGRDESVVTLTFSKRRELMRVNFAVTVAMADVDDYFDAFAGEFALDQGLGACVDCADLKRDHLVSLGWSAKAMRIAYAVSGEGRVERVLVVATDRGDIVLGHDGAAVDMSSTQAPVVAEKSAKPAEPTFIDL